MRENPSQLALCFLSVVLLAPAAFAHTLKPGHAASSHKSAHAAASIHVSAPTRGTPHTEKAELRHASNSAIRSSEHSIAERNLSHARSEETHTSKHLLTSSRLDHRDVSRSSGRRQVQARAISEPRIQSKSRSSKVEEARVEPAVEAPAPETTAAELPPIEVRHNRKVHLTPEASSAPASAASRKATVQDFLDTPAVPADNESPASQTPAPNQATKHPVSIVERKQPALPVLKPAPVIVPDPVTEPVIYTSNGRLIVPPAMKGSHEILLHQNEMADEDGLIRVQDDADLERLRASKQLVALPASAELEVDERLPLNRRYCRPWTAQFLAAMAHAHYAHFHTPLQVNSAVRTVAFQERLRYTNGNAAPADGETASPHLTGQAIDLAKHGLSMTEIAWMRGYLTPLVQQGKVDVEEEFQQACFHISVYKRYMPQPAPRRDIDPRRSPASALATAIH